MIEKIALETRQYWFEVPDEVYVTREKTDSEGAIKDIAQSNLEEGWVVDGPISFFKRDTEHWVRIVIHKYEL